MGDVQDHYRERDRGARQVLVLGDRAAPDPVCDRGGRRDHLERPDRQARGARRGTAGTSAGEQPAGSTLAAVAGGLQRVAAPRSSFRAGVRLAGGPMRPAHPPLLTGQIYPTLWRRIKTIEAAYYDGTCEVTSGS